MKQMTYGRMPCTHKEWVATLQGLQDIIKEEKGEAQK